MSDPFVSSSSFRSPFPQVLREETLRHSQDSDIILLGAISEVWLKFWSLLWLDSFIWGIMLFIYLCTLMMQDRSYFIVMVFLTYGIVCHGILIYVEIKI